MPYSYSSTWFILYPTLTNYNLFCFINSSNKQVIVTCIYTCYWSNDFKFWLQAYFVARNLQSCDFIMSTTSRVPNCGEQFGTLNWNIQGEKQHTSHSMKLHPTIACHTISIKSIGSSRHLLGEQMVEAWFEKKKIDFGFIWGFWSFTATNLALIWVLRTRFCLCVKVRGGYRWWWKYCFR